MESIKITIKNVKEKLSLESFSNIEPGTVFANGTIKNSPDGLFMSTNNPGKKLMWIAKKGYNNDWAVYVHWEEKGFHYVLTQGDKVSSKDNIRKLVDCADDVLSLYRF